MLIKAELQEILHGQRGMIQGIRACLERECMVSSVTLIYAMIDALAALTRPVSDSRTSGSIFRGWLDRYADCSTLNCNSSDLWGARCGVLHLYSPESDLSLSGRANTLYYQWQQGPAADACVDLPSGSIVIKVEELFDFAIKAAKNFQNVADNDKDMTRIIKSHLRQLLCYKPFSTLSLANSGKALS